jgi:hypothetical protein
MANLQSRGAPNVASRKSGTMGMPSIVIVLCRQEISSSQRPQLPAYTLKLNVMYHHFEFSNVDVSQAFQRGASGRSAVFPPARVDQTKNPQRYGATQSRWASSNRAAGVRKRQQSDQSLSRHCSQDPIKLVLPEILLNAAATDQPTPRTFQRYQRRDSCRGQFAGDSSRTKHSCCLIEASTCHPTR